VQGHWRLYDVTMGAQTSAKVTAPAGPVTAQLLSSTVPSDVLPPNDVPASDQIKTKTPVIFVHGFGETASVWSDNGDTMLSTVDSINGVMSLRFDYTKTDHNWVDNPANGPALARYIKAVAAASAQGHGPGKVIVVTFSMGGLLTRYAATMGGAAGDISMVVTIGAPNDGSFLGNARTLICGSSSTLFAAAELAQPGICTQWDAASAMGVFAPEILLLPKLPSSIPVLHAIAGDEIYAWKTWAGTFDINFLGDGVVPTWSALDKRPGGSADDTYKWVTNPIVPGNWSVMHLLLKSYQPVIQLTHDYIQTWVQAHPPQAPAQAAPALGGLAYWLAGGGSWYVHDEQIQISQGPSGLTGDANWNAGGAVIIGHVQIAFTLRPDGSLAGTFTTPSTYTYPPGGPGGFPIPGPADGPQQGQSFILVPVAPMLAKSVPASGIGNPYICQLGLPLPSQYCGA